MNEFERARQVQETIARLDDDRLLAMLSAATGDYTEEALACARTELARRGGRDLAEKRIAEADRATARRAAEEEAAFAAAHRDDPLYRLELARRSANRTLQDDPQAVAARRRRRLTHRAIGLPIVLVLGLAAAAITRGGSEVVGAVVGVVGFYVLLEVLSPGMRVGRYHNIRCPNCGGTDQKFMRPDPTLVNPIARCGFCGHRWRWIA